LDPGRSVLKSVNAGEVWSKMVKVADGDPNAVEKIHVHSPEARRGRGHGVPTPDELKKTKYIVGRIIEKRTSGTPLGVILEILNTSPNGLMRIANEMINAVQLSHS